MCTLGSTILLCSHFSHALMISRFFFTMISLRTSSPQLYFVAATSFRPKSRLWAIVANAGKMRWFSIGISFAATLAS